jgi:hypothetical protein
MSESTILKLEKWVADTLPEDYEKIREEVVKSGAVNADETDFLDWRNEKRSKGLKAFWAEMPGSRTMQ